MVQAAHSAAADISLRSLSELSYTLLLARDLKILSDEEWGRRELRDWRRRNWAELRRLSVRGGGVPGRTLEAGGARPSEQAARSAG